MKYWEVAFFIFDANQFLLMCLPLPCIKLRTLGKPHKKRKPWLIPYIITNKQFEGTRVRAFFQSKPRFMFLLLRMHLVQLVWFHIAIMRAHKRPSREIPTVPRWAASPYTWHWLVWRRASVFSGIFSLVLEFLQFLSNRLLSLCCCRSFGFVETGTLLWFWGAIYSETNWNLQK